MNVSTASLYEWRAKCKKHSCVLFNKESLCLGWIICFKVDTFHVASAVFGLLVFALKSWILVDKITGTPYNLIQICTSTVS